MIARLFWLCVGLIAYAYGGYPLLLGGLARLRPRARPYPAATPTVTLLIAAYNEAEVIGAKLDNSLGLDYPPERLQILVAADGSDDGTAAIVQGYVARGVELVHRPERQGKMAAIMRALPLARGEILVLSDANNFYDAATLQALVAPFADPTVGAVTGAKVILQGDGVLGESEGLYWRYESFIKEQETRLGCCAGVSGEVLAIRRELFEEPPANLVTEDTYMALQLIRRGYRVIYSADARSWERISPTAQDEIARRARIFAGRYQTLARAHRLLPLTRPLAAWSVISHQFARTLIGPVMVGALLTNLALVLRPPRPAARPLLRLAAPYGWLLLLQGGFYGLAWLGGRAEGQGRLARLLYLPTFLVNSNIAGLLGLGRFMLRRQSTLWQRVARRIN